MNSTILQSNTTSCDSGDVLRVSEVDFSMLGKFLSRYGINLSNVNPDSDIPGSFWGDEEAGLVGNQLLVRDDTPIHSLLHESCHYVCMDKKRRDGLDTDAGGDYDEENAVCYLQILLADHIPGFDRQRMFSDMDCWGYTFRLGSARAWFEKDAEDARAYLLNDGLIDEFNKPTFKLRQ